MSAQKHKPGFNPSPSGLRRVSESSNLMYLSGENIQLKHMQNKKFTGRRMHKRASPSVTNESSVRQVSVNALCWQMLAFVGLGLFGVFLAAVVFINLVWMGAIAACFAIEFAKALDIFEVSESVGYFVGLVTCAVAATHFSQEIYYFFLESKSIRTCFERVSSMCRSKSSTNFLANANSASGSSLVDLDINVDLVGSAQRIVRTELVVG